ncbi:MAG: UvrD-helicase domain-containing protein [Prevotella pallens]|uniref:UvrD-helicase domain-containing protein n=1 Tax=Prevotella pallens TaxID=60133 RepID=UPI001CAAA437|nr:UvrD-helicase domain-containing protein [Prevotella pallens]MBF1458311.1 UvrD-helicase domain-containing protein [Prevotella pallens]MBF1489906.1 UvrD-helicase domain-containing protein [Prevotella pallens]MBF1492599.1 UvrD-helicase domain-containing protein [Prevotella pallens]MBF1493788.1 UvrD-helicase domain-containing protein [Prevotella pallens]
MEEHLTVYRASAGSGKTFTLAVEYISLLVKDPENYQHILAVTFTNKATQEMKMRILSQLYGIANSLQSSQQYFNKVKEKTNMPDAVIRNNARAALTLLIHRYNNFRILTIDAFFQQVLRNLAHELGQTANLRVDLNNEEITEKAVDQMIESLEKGQPVLQWISTYINNSIEDDNGWNIIGKIKTFGTNIFKDFYKAHEANLKEQLSNADDFKVYETTLRKRRNDIRKTFNSKAKSILNEIKNANLDIPSNYRSGLYKYLTDSAIAPLTNKPLKAGVLKANESPQNWTSSKCAKADKQQIQTLAAEVLSAQLSELIAYNNDNWNEFQSIQLTLSHLSELRLLYAIADAVDNLTKDTNRFMLSNTQALLKELIADSDTPFIFERIGARLKHVMIDEFQDTSTIQWQNFQVLLANCMAQELSQNLIVGDIKQSVYRWRQGDWGILNNIEKSFAHQKIRLETLDYNYRSEKRIIDFNNTFWEQCVANTAKEVAQDDAEKAKIVQKAYEDVAQKTHKTTENGFVKISLYPSKVMKDAVLEELIETIKELFNNGYGGKNQSKIAILVRSKSNIQDIVNALLQAFGNEINIVSDEAFRLDASLSVNIIVSAMHLLTHPDDVLTRGKLVKLYNQEVLKKPLTDTDLLVSINESNNIDTKNIDKKERRKLATEQQMAKLNSQLPPEYVTNRELLLGLPIVDLVDKLFMLFGLDQLEGQSSYICTLYDTLNDFLKDHTADIDDFINEWENSLSSKTIQSDEIEGIRIMTIHKSKGLEFDNVIIPFCNWEMEKKGTLWCETKNKPAPYNKLPLLPIDFSRDKLIGTVFEDDYKEEHFQNIVDNLNLLYVAFTRASKNLFVFGMRQGKTTLDNIAKGTPPGNRSYAIELALRQVSEQLQGSSLSFPDDIGSEIHFEYGTLVPETHEKEHAVADNPFLIKPDKHIVSIATYPQAATFKQSNKSIEFVKGEDVDPSDRTRYIKIGNVLHQLFSTIYTTADIPTRLNELEQQGIIYNDEITSAQLRTRIEDAITNPQVQEWFSKRWQLYNECTILEYNKDTNEMEEHRPDRVMTDGKEFVVVDFKFGKEREEYKKQVQQYMEILIRMGHKKVSGYLWYVVKNNVVEVNI